jgi:hypothetical protein
MAQSILTADDVRVLATAGPRVAAALRSFTQSMQQAVGTFNASLEFWRIRANTGAAVAALEGLYHVRAALDPAYRSPAALDALVHAVLDGTADHCLLLIPTNRAVVAAAVLRGWTQTHHGGPPPVHGITWHRAFGATHVLVTREAS